MRESSDILGDKLLVGAAAALMLLGILMVYSTTAPFSLEQSGSNWAFLKVHLVHVLLGIGCFTAIQYLEPNFLKKISVPAFFAGIILLIFVLIPGIGHTAGGATRWINLGFVRFQPGELVKLLVALYFASYIARKESKMERFSFGALIPAVVVGMTAMLLLMEPDFGSAAIISIVVLAQLFLVSRPTHLALLGGVGAIAAAALVFSSPYRLRRLTSFMDPIANASDSGYQLVQSLIAIGSGGIFGEGLGAGQQKLFYLPAAHTDFIFSVIAEELGFMGAIFVIGLFVLIAYRGFSIAKANLEDPFRASLAIGITMLIVVPAFLNIGVVSGLLPTKGLVLPFIAYGGTAMIVNLTALGLLCRLSRSQDYKCP